MKDPRQNTLAEIFVTGSAKIAGLECRPFSLGTLTAARLLGLSRVVGECDGPCKDWRMERQMAALLFIQSQPIADVQELVRFSKDEDTDALDERLLAFELEIPLNALAELASQMEADSGSVAAAQFDLESKPGERSEAESPNS
jgi:hypothetical protein